MAAEPKSKNAPAPLAPSTVSTTVKQAYPYSKVVILHTAVGVFTRGQVIDASTFGGEITRLLKCNAIRQATHEECMLDHVDLDAANTPKNLVYELQTKLNEKQAIIDQQEREIQQLRNLNQTAAATTEGNTVNELMTRMKDNDVIIKGLQNELEEAKKKLAEVKKS